MLKLVLYNKHYEYFKFVTGLKNLHYFFSLYLHKRMRKASLLMLHVMQPKYTFSFYFKVSLFCVVCTVYNKYNITNTCNMYTEKLAYRVQKT